ncbi:Clavaminate synthase-like protein [Tilletiopsis washingtonensis]|uniref:Clavaminate synthase-like protein n=1 Tax=Tilletiopsis washingtonensis TaxID=58919 RepID=A0A316ZCK0_9BASI|nr:Clavaminate synthase-like protein [Tilletiopsis washingtonensis]PWN98768.1 Clavaminate synthase-like protein [Tilletiopsis washingtonensis]
MVGYVAQQPLSELPELEADVPMLPHLKLATQDWGRMLWVGGAGTFTPLHRDPHHNLFSQLVGRKRVHLFPPACAAHLHLHAGGPLQNTSRIGSEEPFLQAQSDGAETELWDIEQALSHPDAKHVVLEPADVLFIPKKWLHCVAGLDDSASVNAWFH